MGRKRKVPQGVELKTWHDSTDEDSSGDAFESQIPSAPTTEAILRQDLSSGPSVAPSTDSSPENSLRKRKCVSKSPTSSYSENRTLSVPEGHFFQDDDNGGEDPVDPDDPSSLPPRLSLIHI